MIDREPVRDLRPAREPSLTQIVRSWGRIGCTGFGGPPAHIVLLRELCVERRRWLTAAQFERAIAATNMLPGPTSTQLAIHCAWRVRGVRGALLGGLSFIVPGLVAIVALAMLFLRGSPPVALRAAGMGAGALLAAAIAFAPSFSFVLVGAARFERLLASARVRAFLAGAAPAAAGAIVGAAVPLAGALAAGWQLGVLAGAAIVLLALRRGIVTTLLLAAGAGLAAALLGARVPH